MTKRAKFLYLSLVVLLAFLAVAPHWGTVRQNADDLYSAWQLVRAGETEQPPPSVTVEEPVPEEDALPRRVVASPANTPAEAPETTTPLDPFLTEARSRAIENPAAAMEWLQEQHSGPERLRGMLEVVALWAAEDSESALLWLESNAQGLARIETLQNGVELWAEKDPLTAANWIEGMANDGSKIAAMRSLASTWAKSNPDDASRWVSSLPQGSVRDEAALSLIATWTQLAPETAATWAFAEVELGGLDRAPLLLEEAIKVYTQVDPEGARDYLYDITEAYHYPTVIGKHVLTLAEENPQETATWLTSLAQDDPLNNPALTGSVLRSWAETDSVAASAWLMEQPNSRHRDLAIGGFIEAIKVYEPSAAAEWANTISDPEQRLSALEDSVLNWNAVDPSATTQWLANTDIEPDLRAMLAELTQNQGQNQSDSRVNSP